MARFFPSPVKFLAAAMAVAISACATTPVATITPEAVLEGIAGDYDNAAQWAQLEPGFKTGPLAPVAVRFVPVRADAVGPLALYEEWRNAETAAPLRQRLWVLHAAGPGVRVERFRFDRPDQVLGAGADAFLTLRKADLAPLGDGCDLTAASADSINWDARTAPAGCKRPGATMPMHTRITKMPTGVLYAEDSAEDARVVLMPFDLRKR